MQIPILQGIYTTEESDFRQSLPVNMEPVIIDSGISKGYLRTAPGIVQLGGMAGPGADRGAIVWNGVHYRVMGSKFIRVDAVGVVTVLGDVGPGGPVTFDYSFDRLGIASGARFFYWDGSTLTAVTDPDLGQVIDFIWVDGYFMTTDGEYLVVTELQDPTQVDPLKYGSSEADPDPVIALVKLRGEVYALNRYTIEVFQNRGTTGFPFQRQPGAMIPKGCVGTHAKASLLETFAFVGGSRDEDISVYLAGDGTAIPIGTREVDILLNELTPTQQGTIELEARKSRGDTRLLVHLPTGPTMVYYHEASKASGMPIWTIHRGGIEMDQAYPLRHLCLVDGQWVGGTEDGRLGCLDYGADTHFSSEVGWRFDTAFAYNEGLGVIFKSLELVGTPGRAPMGADPRVFMSYTLDGETWSQERALSYGRRGNRAKRVQWRPMIHMRRYAGLRFRGASTGVVSWARLEAEVEGLAV